MAALPLVGIRGYDAKGQILRAASGETVIVAGGTSCRHQSEHVTGRRAVHPAQAPGAALTRYRQRPLAIRPRAGKRERDRNL